MKVVNVTTLGEMCEFLLDGEPCFVIRAKDICATEAIKLYIELARKAGSKNVIRATEHMSRVWQWQQDHKNKVKVPD